MSPAIDHERLLDDVLGDGLPAEFRAALLGETLRLARRRRRARQTRRVAAMLAVLAGVAALLWRGGPPRRITPEVANQPAAIVHTQPLPARDWVTTQPLPADWVVASVRTAGIVTTPSGDGQFRVIDDNELLALVAPKPVALVRWAPHAAELVFVNPADQKALLGN